MIPPHRLLSRLAGLALAGALCAGCVLDKTGQSALAASDREMRRTQQRVAALEDHFTNELQSTSQELTSVRKDSEQNQANLANSEALLEELLVQTQSTLGSLERLQKRLAELEEDQDRLQSNMEFQLLEYDRRLAAIEAWARNAEDGLDSAGKAAPPAAPPEGETASQDDEPGSSPATTVERARAALAAGKPKSAIKMLKGFEKKYPGAPELLDARFLYAQALQEDGKGADAIAVYQTIIESHPGSPRLPEAMLALGQGLRQLGEAEEAKFFLGELVRIYPDSPQAKQAKKALAEIK